ncbi:MAG: hypothetical protein A2133_06155 [Actinobacteria bacterium RBG_16_64_13]|nr:MAG: hypothetical protein A2133_06155 [Actinobacteria bacterium RBG_16_64_13]
MKTQRLLVVLTGINVVILVLALVLVLRPEVTPDISSVLRGRSLEIIDSRGRVRAQLFVAPPSTVDDQPYPETVLFRLINPDGGPGVKIATSLESSGLLFSRKAENPLGWSGVQILSEEPGGLLRLVGADGGETVQP